MFPYDKRPGRSSQRHVPMHVARQLAEQRDKLAEQVHQLQRERDQLAAAHRTLEARNETLDARARQAEQLAGDLRAQLDQRAQAQREQDQRAKDQRERDRSEALQPVSKAAPAESTEAAESAETIERLNRRIDELLGDLERVRGKASQASVKAARQEKVRLVSGLGDVLDSIERGLSLDATGAWRQGLEAIYRQLTSFLRAEGVHLIGEPGEPLDPRLHEATGVVEATDFESGLVARVDRHGLQLDDGTVVRPAQVAVARSRQ
ncbi:MAG: nucleotide exchange factor GrpE [Persicimonas sp.]